jgi:death on curing protein
VLAATIAFFGVNGYRLTYTNDEAYELIMAIAAGTITEVPEIGANLAAHIEPWSGPASS